MTADYDWQTDMRASNDPNRSGMLLGQAGASFVPAQPDLNFPECVTLLVMPDRWCFAAQATISGDDMDALVDAWLTFRAEQNEVTL